MKIFKPQTSKGPANRFTGNVHPTIIFRGEKPSRAGMASVHFEPGARSAWHKHALGQYIHVVEGMAYVQERGSKLTILQPGDTIYTESGVEHWHGASPDGFMVHTVVMERPDDSSQEETTWLELVTDEEYSQKPESLE
jgi:quercetin dioxygenase-like cupin family protein